MFIKLGYIKNERGKENLLFFLSKSLFFWPKFVELKRRYLNRYFCTVNLYSYTMKIYNCTYILQITFENTELQGRQNKDLNYASIPVFRTPKLFVPYMIQILVTLFLVNIFLLENRNSCTWNWNETRTPLPSAILVWFGFDIFPDFRIPVLNSAIDQSCLHFIWKYKIFKNFFYPEILIKLY